LKKFELRAWIFLERIFLKISRTQKIFSGSFPKTISSKFFSVTFTKKLSRTRDNHPVRDFPKMPHRTFREDSCIQSPPRSSGTSQTGRHYRLWSAPFFPSPSQRLVGFKAGRCAGCDRRMFAFCRQALPAHYTCYLEIS
jgi:hypothetical protein